MSTNPKYKDIKCSGITINVIDKRDVNALRFGIEVLYAIHKLYPDDFQFRSNYLDKLFGDTYLTEMITDNKTPTQIFDRWESDLNKFNELREKYLFY